MPEVVPPAEAAPSMAPTATDSTSATAPFQDESGKAKGPAEDKPLPKPSDSEEKPKDAKPDAEDSKGSDAKLDEILSILKGLAGLDKKPENPMDAAPVVEMKDPVPPAKFAEEIGKRDATIQTLTEKLAKFEAKEREDVSVAAALKALEGVTGVDEKTVREVYLKFEDKGLTAWVEGRKINAPAEPNADWAKDEHGVPTDAKDTAKFESDYAAMPMTAQQAYPRGKKGYIEDRRLAIGLPVKE